MNYKPHVCLLSFGKGRCRPSCQCGWQGHRHEETSKARQEWVEHAHRTQEWELRHP